MTEDQLRRQAKKNHAETKTFSSISFLRVATHEVILAFEKVLLTLRSLFVFPRDNPQKNVVSLLTGVSVSVLFLFQIVPCIFLSMAALSATNTKISNWLLVLFQPIRLWLSELPYRAK